jgi:PAS domain S-box-containing protein
VTTERSDKGISNDDATEQAVDKLEAPLAPYWLPAIIESADDAIISKTLQGIITSWNKAAERIFGYKADEIIGKPVLVIIPPELQSEETIILSKIRSGDRVDHFETVRLRKDGTRVDISLTISPIRTPDGKIIGASKIARDITDKKRAERERQVLLKAAEDARREAEMANRAKDNFLALLSHELRTPLHSMRGWLSMLSNGLLNDEQQERALDVILRGVDSQNALVEDLLDVSRIVSGKMSIVHEKISLVSILSNVIEQMRPATAEHHIELATDLDTSADEIIGDSVRVQQIISNLINNAVKYTPPEGRISVSLTRTGDNAVIEVRDTGIGIEPEIAARIFERFEQGDNSSRRQFGGLGLGLAIARHLTELHDGKIEVESEGPGRGATFRVTLPLMKSYTSSFRSSFPAHFEDEKEVPLDHMKVLIVEDDVDSLEMLRLVLENSGAVVTSVDRSQKAVDELGRNKFDIMISDLGLPGMDGHDLIREIRGSLGIDADELPAIALSGYAADDDRHRSLSNGFQMHLQKPLDVSTLASTIRNLLDQTNRNQPAKLASID